MVRFIMLDNGQVDRKSSLVKHCPMCDLPVVLTNFQAKQKSGFLLHLAQITSANVEARVVNCRIAWCVQVKTNGRNIPNAR